jgi:putative MFS transporter
MSAPAGGAPWRADGPAPLDAGTAAELIGRIERLPVTPRLMFLRIVIGIATFFDGYTVIAIVFAMPQLVAEWNLARGDVGLVFAAGYAGQLVGALMFGALAERIGRLRVLLLTILVFVAMDVACLFAWSGLSMMAFRFIQGLGTGGEVPVASAYVSEFIGAGRRGRFFLLYEVIFPVGLMFAAMTGFFLVPRYGWRAMFVVGLVPAVLTIPLRFVMPESPRWLASRGRLKDADAIVRSLEDSATRHGAVLAPPALRPLDDGAPGSRWRELFEGVYLRRTVTLWSLWACTYLINNGLVTWLPTLYRQVFELPLQVSLAYGWITASAGVVASIVCALLIDRVGRRPWYAAALLSATLPLVALAGLGAGSAVEVLILATAAYAILQTVTFSLYLYSAELYPTRLRAIGTGFGSAWLRAGSSIGPLLVAYLGIRWVFAVFGAVALIAGVITLMFAIETRGRVLEDLSP